MVTPTAGTVVLVPFPFSDLSKSKLRPAVVLADVGRDDWILCQITSNPYSDVRAIELLDTSFATGSLLVTSYARPGKLFTANHSLMVGKVGRWIIIEGIQTMSDEKLTPIHPGEVLLEEFLKPMKLSQNRLAIDIGVPARRINEIVLGKRRVSADTALGWGAILRCRRSFG